jgi:acyl-CoA synthetase (AMP-forming)/AMP-acid ligase II
MELRDDVIERSTSDRSFVLPLFSYLAASNSFPVLNPGTSQAESFVTLKDRAEHVVLHLLNAENDRPVAIAASSPSVLVACILACWVTNRAPALINPRATISETRAIIESLDPSIALLDAEASSREVGRIVGTQLAVVDDRQPRTNDKVKLTWELFEASAPALILCTSGTTGTPKLVELSWKILRNNVELIGEWLRLSPDDAIYIPLPLFHMAGLYPLLAGLSSRCRVFAPGWFDERAGADLLRKGEITVAWPVFPVIAQRLVNALEGETIASVRLIEVGAAIEVIDALEQIFPDAACINGYGSTELGFATTTPISASRETRTTTLGYAAAGTSVEVHAENGALLGPEEVGEIWVRGPQVMERYRGSNAHTFTSGDWLKTGDLGFFDSKERLHLLGRADDMMKLSGELVSPLEVEAVIESHPKVNTARVIAVPNERGDNTAIAFVESKDGDQPNSAELREWCRTKLSAYKVPAVWLRISQWPMSATKISRLGLKEFYLAGGSSSLP